MQYLRIVEWARHQHYKKRRPPWIKLYRDLLSDYEFSKLSAGARWHLIGLFLLAARTDNAIPYDAEWIKAEIGAGTRIDFTRIIASGFIEIYEQGSIYRQRREETETEKNTDILASVDFKDATNGQKIRRDWMTMLGEVGLPDGFVKVMPNDLRNKPDGSGFKDFDGVADYAVEQFGSYSKLRMALIEALRLHKSGKRRMYTLYTTLTDPAFLKAQEPKETLEAYRARRGLSERSAT